MRIKATRKDHVCDGCLEIIPKGSPAEYCESRYAVFEKVDGDPYEGKQIGIGYYKGWYHLNPGTCEENNNKNAEFLIKNLQKK